MFFVYQALWSGLAGVGIYCRVAPGILATRIRFTQMTQKQNKRMKFIIIVFFLDAKILINK